MNESSHHFNSGDPIKIKPTKGAIPSVRTQAEAEHARSAAVAPP